MCNAAPGIDPGGVSYAAGYLPGIRSERAARASQRRQNSRKPGYNTPVFPYVFAVRPSAPLYGVFRPGNVNTPGHT